MNQKNVERELLQQEYDNNKSQLEQLKHQQERLENRIAYYEKGERKKRTCFALLSSFERSTNPNWLKN